MSEPASDTKTTEPEKPTETGVKTVAPSIGTEEQTPEVSTSTEDVVQSKPNEEPTLILSADADALICTNNNSDEAAKAAPGEISKQKKKEARNHVWVSNISRGTKAADLKKLFTADFKVESAKIVTNGKCFFGYISLSTPEMAQRSVKALNGINLGGRNIAVSLFRPDLKAKGKTREKKPTKEHKQAKETDNKSVKEEKNKPEKPTESSLVADLKKKIDMLQSDLRFTNRRLNDANKREDYQRKQKAGLVKEMERLEQQLKVERRKMAQEMEALEKKKKQDDIRFEQDRALLNKQLDECKKLREYLEKRIDEFNLTTRRRSRSPLLRRNGSGTRSYPNRRHSDLERNQRSRPQASTPKPKAYESKNRQFTPSPPRLSKRSPPPRRSPKKPRTEFSSNGTYSAGPSSLGGTKMYPPHRVAPGPSFPPPSPYRYGQPSWYTGNAYPVGMTQASGLNSSRPLNYAEFNKGLPGVSRKY